MGRGFRSGLKYNLLEMSSPKVFSFYWLRTTFFTSSNRLTVLCSPPQVCWSKHHGTEGGTSLITPGDCENFPVALAQGSRTLSVGKVVLFLPAHHSSTWFPAVPRPDGWKTTPSQIVKMCPEWTSDEWCSPLNLRWSLLTDNHAKRNFST